MHGLQGTNGVVCVVAVICLIFLSKCWTVQSSASIQELNFTSQQTEQVESQMLGAGANGFDDRFQLHSGANSENTLKEIEVNSNISTEVLPGLCKRNKWCMKLSSLSGKIFGFSLEDEKSSWPEFKLGWRTGSAVILGALGAAISSAGGLGGGGLFVPLFNLLLQFDAKTSAALSNFMILGGSLANLYINLREAHPSQPDKPLIDFDVVMLLQPNMLLGISIGVILNVMLPDWVITALLTVTLGYMSFHSLKCGLRRWKKESQQNRNRKNQAAYVHAPDFHHDDSSSGEDGATDSDIPSNVEETSDDVNGGECGPKSTDMFSNESALSEPFLLKHEPDTFSIPVNSILALGFTWLAFFAVQVLRGSKENQSFLGIEACGSGYWLITLTQIPIALGMTAWTIHRFQACHVCKVDLESRKEEGFSLKPESCTLFAWMALMTGVLGGLLGIGGGMIINPILLTIGMLPQVTAVTCASMVFFSSSMSVVQFWLMGRVPVQFALSGALICAVSSFVGVTLLHHAIDKYNRASLIVFSVTTVMGVSAVLMAGFGSFGVWQTYREGGYMGFHYPC